MAILMAIWLPYGLPLVAMLMRRNIFDQMRNYFEDEHRENHQADDVAHGLMTAEKQ
jgi:hypothetical protein